MFKSFQDFNDWWSNHVPQELVTTITRAQSRVNALLNRISNIVQEYTSAYNSVQTLGYDNVGSIEDQTSAERLTVPQNVINRAVNNLQTQYTALISDKTSFVNAYNSHGLLVNLHSIGINNLELQSGQLVIPIHPYGLVIIKEDKSAQFMINSSAMRMMIQDSFNIPDRDAYASPLAVFVKVSQSNRIITAFYTSQSHYPQLLPTYNLRQWQLIIHYVDQAHAKVYFEINIAGSVYWYLATITLFSSSDYSWLSEFTEATPGRAFTDWSSYITFCNDNSLMLPDTITDAYGITYDGTRTVGEPQASLTTAQWNAFIALFTTGFSQFQDAVVTSNNDEQLAANIFETVLPVTTGEVQDLIQTLI